jgi:hypothetical protein
VRENGASIQSLHIDAALYGMTPAAEHTCVPSIVAC